MGVNDHFTYLSGAKRLSTGIMKHSGCIPRLPVRSLNDGNLNVIADDYNYAVAA